MKRRFVLLAVLAAAGAAALAFASSALGGTYIVLYKQQAVPGDAKSRIQRAGGTLVYAYDQIGVAIARSSSTAFASNMARDDRVEGAVLTAPYATRLSPVQLTASGPPAGGLPNAPATDSDTFSGLQWDMRQIKAPDAHAITCGSPLVIAGDLDTGLDYTHPDLAQNVDFADSTSCESGAPNSAPAAWDDHFGHGTHTAGTIAAAANGIGIVGVAPNVKIAAVKTSNDDGFFFPEMVVCAFMWAGTHHFDVTNNSYFADPWYFTCRYDPVQRAIWKAEQRAILFAESQGVTVVAAEGNESEALAHPTVAATSPDFPPGVPRRVTNACVVIPVEVPGGIGVSGVGDYRQKAYFSNYGVGVIHLTAPSGDDLQVSPEAPNGLVLSTYPQHPVLLDLFGVKRVEDCKPPGGP